MSLRDTDEQLNKILASIQRKVTEISMKYSSDNFQTDNEAIGNFGGSGGKLDNIPASLREAIFKAGGTGNSLVMIPSMNGDPNPLIPEIEIGIGKILATLLPGSKSRSSEDGDFDDIGASGLDLFDINCNGTISPIKGIENSDVDPNDLGDASGDIFSMNENDLDGLNGSYSGDDTADSAMADAVDKALNKMDQEILAKEQNARACAYKDLGLMKAFLAILNVIVTIKNSMNPLMNITMDTVKITVLASGCWNNPTNISEIIQRIIVKVVALLIMIVSAMVQMFWELIGMDCLTEEAKSVIDQIKEALTGLSSTYNKCQRLSMTFGTNTEQFRAKDAFEEAQSAINEAMKLLTTDNLKEMFPNMEDIAKDVYNNGLGGKNGMKQSMVDSLKSTGAYDDIRCYNRSGHYRRQQKHPV